MGTSDVHGGRGEDVVVSVEQAVGPPNDERLARADAGAEPGAEVAADADAEPAPPPGEVRERLGAELARLRARSSVDPTIAGRSLAPAWIGAAAGVEDDEAEFIDAMADCRAAGLSLDTALSCWHAGELAYEPDDDDEDTDEVTAPGGPSAPEPAHAASHLQASSGRRLFIR